MSGPKRSYTPVDDLLQQAPVRILRALRFCGWIDVYDLRDLVLDCAHEDKQSKDAIATALIRLARAGLVEKRESRMRSYGHIGSASHCYDLRITPKGRAWLADKLKPDTRIAGPREVAARPGTEHLLIAEDACA